jgi:hypothetical protein
MNDPRILENQMRQAALDERVALSHSVDQKLLRDRIRSEILSAKAPDGSPQYPGDSKSRVLWKSLIALPDMLTPSQWIPAVALLSALAVALVSLPLIDHSKTGSDLVSNGNGASKPSIEDWIQITPGPQEFSKIFTTAATLPEWVNQLEKPIEREWNLVVEDARIAMNSALSTLTPTWTLYQPIRSLPQSEIGVDQ